MISEWTFGNPVLDPSMEKSGLLGRQSNPEVSEPSECWETAGQKKRKVEFTQSPHMFHLNRKRYEDEDRESTWPSLVTYSSAK